MRLVSAVEHLACTGISGVPRILEQGGTSTISGFSGENLLMSKKTSSCEAPVLWTSFIAHIHTTYPSPTQPELLNGFALFPGLVPVWIGGRGPPPWLRQWQAFALGSTKYIVLAPVCHPILWTLQQYLSLCCLFVWLTLFLWVYKDVLLNFIAAIFDLV